MVRICWCLVLVSLFSCSEVLKNNTSTYPNVALAAIRDLAHNFYKLYSSDIELIENVDSGWKFSKMDMADVTVYHAQMIKIGSQNQAYNDMARHKQY